MVTSTKNQPVTSTRLSLDGTWEFRKVGEDVWRAGSVPGSLYQDLFTAGISADFFYRENDHDELAHMHHDYEYRRTFTVDSNLLGHDKVVLVCEGLDTLCEVRINGQKVGVTENMHRTYDFDALPFLHVGENDISIHFSSPTNYIAARQAERPIWSVNGLEGFPYIRKAHYMFGWDWGPALPDIGIWRPIYLEARSHGRLNGVYVTQQHGDHEVALTVDITFDRWTEMPFVTVVTLTAPNGDVMSREFTTCTCSGRVQFTVENPELWWPNGLGSQPLYHVSVSVYTDEQPLACKELNIGLRTLTVQQTPDEWGTSFNFCVNGIDIFAMGADYIPEDNLIGRVRLDQTDRLLRDCVRANFNCIRVWGGGYYLDDSFYDLCDHYGLIVWQDLMFACAAYEFTESFKENVSIEIRQNMERIRHHACLGLWCGNNELEWAWVEWDFDKKPRLRADYIKQFEVCLPDIAKEVDPNTFYWLASPSSVGSFDDPNSENHGDMHDWAVWHGREPFVYFRKKYPRFMSEFGLQSFPNVKTIRAFAEEQDLNIFSSVIENHQKHPNGIEPIVYYISQYFRMPKDFATFTYVSQLIQAEGVRTGVEHWRRNRGRCMGAVYWQLNDCWPGISWSSIDYYGRWKALHYAAKRFFAPILISALEEGTQVALHLANESTQTVTGVVHWQLCDAAGQVVNEGTQEATATAFSSSEVLALEFGDYLKTRDQVRSHFVSYVFTTDSEVVSEGVALFVPARDFAFLPGRAKVRIEDEADSFALYLTSDVLLKFVEIDFDDLDVVLSDNYFDVVPGVERRIVIQKQDIPFDVDALWLSAHLKAQSLVDTY